MGKTHTYKQNKTPNLTKIGCFPNPKFCFVLFFYFIFWDESVAEKQTFFFLPYTTDNPVLFIPITKLYTLANIGFQRKFNFTVEFLKSLEIKWGFCNTVRWQPFVILSSDKKYHVELHIAQIITIIFVRHYLYLILYDLMSLIISW